MSIIRVRKESNFVIVSRFPLEDERLTWEARGLYGFLLAKPDNWQISLKHLTRSSPAGYDKTKRILSELVDFKYIRKEERRNQHGQFSFPAYTIYELPYDGHFTGGENPPTVKPPAAESGADSPLTADPQLIKIQSTKEEIKTTTTELVWPDQISASDRVSMLELSGKLEPVVVQTLLDEMSGKLDSIKSPVSYFFTLIKKYKAGAFVGAISNSVSASRESKLATEARYQRLLKESEARAQKLFQEHESRNG
jgi:hypothetical protein